VAVDINIGKITEAIMKSFVAPKLHRKIKIPLGLTQQPTDKKSKAKKKITAKITVWIIKIRTSFELIFACIKIAPLILGHLRKA
jgi:ABC-type methionine transport system permease subunit